MGKIIKIPSVEVIDTKVAGVSKENEDGVSRQDLIRKHVHEDDQVILTIEQNNQYDVHAVGVLTIDKIKIGYLQKEIAPRVKSAIENEAEVHSKVSWVSGEKYVGVGLRIELVS